MDTLSHRVLCVSNESRFGCNEKNMASSHHRRPLPFTAVGITASKTLARPTKESMRSWTFIIGMLAAHLAQYGRCLQQETADDIRVFPAPFTKRLGGPAQPSSKVSLSNSFPSLQETAEMARLSSLIYKFHRAVDDDLICPMINANYSAYRLHCHWYSHRGNSSESDTQVMIVSSNSYVAVVFAGTDDLETSLTDVHLLQTAFGDENHSLVDPNVKVHAGFNKAVFYDGIYDLVLQKLIHIYASASTLKPLTRRKTLYITGHSLGAANSVLTAVALASHSSKQLPKTIISINFGCPRIGNLAYRDYVHENPIIQSSLSIWRVVLGWDLVARLPELYYHAGHTIQLYETVKNDTWSAYWWPAGANKTAPVAYYRHYGDLPLKLAGVPFGWYAMPFLWLPGALNSHRMANYYAAMLDMQEKDWVKGFMPITNESGAVLEDDEWKNPDDLIQTLVKKQ
jgi:hypothetical protein